MKFLILTVLSLFSFKSFSFEGTQCSAIFNSDVKNTGPVFENGHNIPLKNIMIKMKEYEGSIQEFVQSLRTKIISDFLKDNSNQYRSLEKLDEILDTAKKYEKILKHLVEHSEHMMMSPRIQMIPEAKRFEFIQKYKQAYIDYLKTYQQLVLELESFREQDPSTWNGQNANDIFMELHAQMGAAHNKF